MNQQEFLQRLSAALSPLSDAERGRILDYYREMICDGLENGRDEQALIDGFGTPGAIAAQILTENAAAEPEEALPTVPAVASAGPEPDAADYAAREPVRTILIDARHVSVELRSVPRGAVQVHFSPTESDRVSVSEQNGVFSFRHSVEFPFFHWRSLFSIRRIVVDIPSDFHGDLQVSTCNARLTAADLPGLGAVQLSTSNGRLSVSNLRCASLGLTTSNGPVELQNITGNSCTARTSNGHITASFCAFPDGLYLHTSNAAIRGQSLSSDNLDLISSNGSISAVIQGDLREYAIYSHTSNASNTLPPELVFPGQTKRLNVQTNNASIDVRFA